MKNQTTITCPHCEKEIHLGVTTERSPNVINQEIGRQTEGLRSEVIRLRGENRELKKRLESK